MIKQPARLQKGTTLQAGDPNPKALGNRTWPRQAPCSHRLSSQSRLNAFVIQTKLNRQAPAPGISPPRRGKSQKALGKRMWRCRKNLAPFCECSQLICECLQQVIPGQNFMWMVYVRYFWQGKHQGSSCIQCVNIVLANPTYELVPGARSLQLLEISGDGGFVGCADDRKH